MTISVSVDGISGAPPGWSGFTAGDVLTVQADGSLSTSPPATAADIAVTPVEDVIAESDVQAALEALSARIAALEP